jgi:multiple sugar transport system substrate-binding protein
MRKDGAMKRHGSMAVLACLVMLVGACTAGGGSQQPTPTSVNPSASVSHAPVTLTLWTFFTNPELKEFKSVLSGFESQYPWITVNVVGGKDQTAVLQSINSGTAPDVAQECCPDDSAKYCSTDAFQDLNPYIKADGIDITKVVPPGALAYTGYQGKQCSLPTLTDAYGLYYNTKMFQDAGLSGPPKTYSEFFADVKKLTKFNADGSIKVAGFLPLQTGDYELANFVNGVYSGAQWYDASVKCQLGTDTRFAKDLQFVKQMTDWFGYDKLQRWFASVGGENSEFSPSNAFEQGKLAMDFDGEWRVGFIQNDKSNVPYATAPMAVPDDSPQLYGVGQIGGTIIGIPRGVPHSDASWLLVKFLALDTQAETELGQALHNVPTTFEAAKDPTLAADPHFKTFLDIFANPNSRYKQITPLGLEDTTLYDQFVDKYLAGKASDLQGGLQQVASQIDKQQQLGG